jgi:hypothetical protein
MLSEEWWWYFSQMGTGGLTPRGAGRSPAPGSQAGALRAGKLATLPAGDSACWQTAHRAQAAAPRRILHRSDQSQPPAKGQEKHRQRSPGQRSPPVARPMAVAVGSARALPPACRRAEPRALPLCRRISCPRSKIHQFEGASQCRAAAHRCAPHDPRPHLGLPAPRCPP